MTTTFQSARATSGELTDEYHTANDEWPPSSSTRRKEVIANGTTNDTIKSTGQPGYFARECPAEDQARKPQPPVTQFDQVNYREDEVASECTGPLFCLNYGMAEHSASQCQNTAVQEDLAYSLWAAQPKTSHTTSDNEMVLMLRPAEAAHVATPLTITCGKIQMQSSPEPTTFDPSGRTIMSIHFYWQENANSALT